MGTAYGRGRDAERPLLIGSVKTNIGHLEAAAGVAGLMKATLAMKRGVIPRHLNYRDPNPETPWERLPLQVTAEPTEWPLASDRPHLSGVSGFGWSGTNAHVVLQGYGPPEVAPGYTGLTAGPAKPVPLALPEPPQDAAAPRVTRVLPSPGSRIRPCGSWRRATSPGSMSAPPTSLLRGPTQRRFSRTWPGRPARAAATSRTGRASRFGTPGPRTSSSWSSPRPVRQRSASSWRSKAACSATPAGRSGTPHPG